MTVAQEQGHLFSVGTNWHSQRPVPITSVIPELSSCSFALFLQLQAGASREDMAFACAGTATMQQVIHIPVPLHARRLYARLFWLAMTSDTPLC